MMIYGKAIVSTNFHSDRRQIHKCRLKIDIDVGVNVNTISQHFETIYNQVFFITSCDNPLLDSIYGAVINISS